MMKLYSGAFNLRLALLAASTLLISACGQSGNLVLPQKTNPNSPSTSYSATAAEANTAAPSSH